MMKPSILTFVVVLLICAFFGVDLAEPAENVPAQRNTVLLFNRNPDWYGLPVDADADGSILAREIVRQAFMIAARDELGLTTRDVLIGEQSPKDNPLVFDVLSHYGKENPRLSFIREQQDAPEVLLEIPTNYQSPLDYVKLVADMEVLSRTRLADGLRESVSKVLPLPENLPKASPERPVPSHADQCLSEMSFISQFEALHELHAAIRTEGESELRLGALVRGYANLGMLTSYYATPMFRAFQARSLLYAQRMVAKNPKSAFAMEHRAYAMALVGYHQRAITALEQAKALRKREPTQKPDEPAWADLIRRYCRVEVSQITAPDKNPELKQVAEVLKARSTWGAGSTDYEIEAGLHALEIAPECYLIMCRLCKSGGVILGHSMTLRGPAILADTFYDRVIQMADAPESARSVAKELKGDQSPLAAVFHGETASDDSVRLQAKFTTGLAAEDGKPEQELSHAVLGRMFDEAVFIQTLCRAQFEGQKLCIEPDEFITRARPLVTGHPYAAYLESYAWDLDQRKRATQKLATAFRDDLVEIRHLYLFTAPGHEDLKAWARWYHRAYINCAETAEDFWEASAYSNQEVRIADAHKLQLVSRSSPIAKIELINLDWKHAKDSAAKWEQEALPDHPAVLAALAKVYERDQQLADATRCYEAAAKAENSIEQIRALAKYYQRQGKTDDWIAKLEECLTLPDYGLAHASIHGDLAKHYSEEHEWEKALSHAEEAASSGSGWGLAALGNVYEALQRWDEAEACYRGISTRYRGSEADWYFFCCRTGEGDLKGAQTLVKEALAKSVPEKCEYIVEYYLVNHETRRAIDFLGERFKTDPRLITGLFLALLTDDAAQRDATFKTVLETDQKVVDGYDKGDRHIFELIKTLAADQAAGGKADFDLAVIEKSRPENIDFRPIHYLAYACYFDKHGKPAEAKECLIKAVTASPNSDDTYRTLAGAFLIDRGIKPAEYKERWAARVVAK